MFRSVGPIAVIQFSPDSEDVWSNLDKMKMFVTKASLRGATVVIFPELSLSKGWFDDKNDASLFAQTVDGYQSRAIQDIANATMTTIVFGYVELTEYGTFCNSAAVIGPDTGILLNVRKHNLGGFDHMWAVGCDEMFPIVTFENCRMGVLIGDDVVNTLDDSYEFLQNPPQKFYQKGSVDLICVLESRSYESIDFPHEKWMSLAKSLKVNVAVANKVGTDITTIYGGGSCVIDRDLRIWTDGSSFDCEAIVGGSIS